MKNFNHHLHCTTCPELLVHFGLFSLGLFFLGVHLFCTTKFRLFCYIFLTFLLSLRAFFWCHNIVLSKKKSLTRVFFQVDIPTPDYGRKLLPIFMLLHQHSNELMYINSCFHLLLFLSYWFLVENRKMRWIEVNIFKSLDLQWSKCIHLHDLAKGNTSVYPAFEGTWVHVLHLLLPLVNCRPVPASNLVVPLPGEWLAELLLMLKTISSL